MRVLITGGGHGIGRATAEQLLERGHDVTVFDIEQDYLDSLPDEITTYHGDVADKERTQEVVEQEEFEVLVNCAGFQQLGAVEDMGAETFERHFKTNIFGPANLCRAALPTLRENEGRIVNISSLAGLISTPYWGAYCASKHAIEAFSDALRMEVKQYGVGVVIVEPGPVRTGFNEQGRKGLRQYLPGSVYADDYREILGRSLGGIPPEKAAEKIVRIIETDSPDRRYTITWQAWLAPKLETLLPQKLWEWLVKKNS